MRIYFRASEVSVILENLRKLTISWLLHGGKGVNSHFFKTALLDVFGTLNTLYVLYKATYAKKFKKKLQLNYFNDPRHGGGGADQCLS
jgi:hypothetical protein